MQLFDLNGDGYVNFDEFLVGIRVSNPTQVPRLTAKVAAAHTLMAL
jgi:hypothetical protein